ncbi:MAG: tRNA (adenosine(37)-N6)-dimethylallyltransferase MiaA [Eubacteriales bacterium]
MAEKIFVLTGPTASGKTALGTLLAETISGEVVSADSMQIYQGLDIGTAKPTAEEKRDIPHHMLDIVSPEQNFSVVSYVAMADKIVKDILSRGKVPIIVGGTGQYIHALVRGLHFPPVPEDSGLRKSLEEEISQVGGEVMLQRLEKVDLETAQRLFPNDHKRIVRALEIFQASGKTQSAFDRESRSFPPVYDALELALNFSERSLLRQRICQRVDEMIVQGLMEEVERFLHLKKDCSAMQAIGYKELRPVLAEGADFEEAVNLLKIRSGQYAKRQETWIRHKSSATWYHWEEKPNIQNALQVSTALWSEFQV